MPDSVCESDSNHLSPESFRSSEVFSLRFRMSSWAKHASRLPKEQPGTYIITGIHIP